MVERSGGAEQGRSVRGAQGGRQPTILHVDMDAFFASVEVLDRPELAGKPVIVGGSGARGVVAACTYEARIFGIHSAMPSGQARRLCPHAVFVAGRYHRYAEVSGRLHDILRSFTPQVEGIALDEAFLDVTGAVRLLGAPEEIARAIRTRVEHDLSLTCSVGVARTKLVAKLASKAAKPKVVDGSLRSALGVVVVPPEEELDFLHPLPVDALWGVGPATEKRLRGVGIRTVGDLTRVPAPTLVRLLGFASGSHLAELAWARDARPVVPDRLAKSVGHEETFARDVRDADVLAGHVVRMADAVAGHLRDAGLAGRTITVKIRFDDFTTITRSHTLPSPVDTAQAISAVARHLLGSVDPSGGVRLLGVSTSGFGSSAAGDAPPAEQLSFEGIDGERAPAAREDGFPESSALQATWEGVSRAVDTIRGRYGDRSVGPASLLDSDGLRLRRRGDAQWGPGGT